MNTSTQNDRFANLSTGYDLDDWVNTLFGGRRRTAWFAAASAWEEDERFHIEVDVPGVTQEDLQITFDKGHLSLTMERKLPEGQRKHVHDERGYGQLTRKFALPETADRDGIEATLSLGVLHLSIPKKQEAQPKRIEIKTS